MKCIAKEQTLLGLPASLVEAVPAMLSRILLRIVAFVLVLVAASASAQEEQSPADPPAAESPAEPTEEPAEPVEEQPAQPEEKPVEPVAVAAPAESLPEISPEVLAAQAQREEAVARASSATVSVFVPGGQGGGSGVVITPDGYALTNYHVSKPAGPHMKCSMPDGVLYDAVIVSIDPTGDVALIKLLGRDDFPHAVLADSDLVQEGDWCYAIGNPFLLATDFNPTVTYGIVSGVHRYQYPAGTLLEYADCIQTDAAINPGNSGGPLFNAKGELIGINGRGSFEKRGRVNVGVGYAISINQIKHFMGYLRSGRIVDHATLGATVSSDEENHVIITNIVESSDAYRRGLRYGDEVVEFGGRPIHTVNGFKNVLGIFPKGWRVPLTYRRDGKQYDIFVRLAGVHRDDELLEKIGGAKPLPEPGEEEEKDPEAPKQPRPIPMRPGALGKPAMPANVAKLYEARAGYTNYYFNRLNQQRIWQSLTSKGDFAGLTSPWEISGEVEGGGALKLTLADASAKGVFPAGEFTLDTAGDLDQQLAPEGSGGLLVALHVWRRLLLVGPEKYGDLYYLGTAPHVGLNKKVDVLVGVFDVTETHFQFDPDSGELVGLEMYPDGDVDPCELLFSDYKEVEGRQLPHTITVKHGDHDFATLHLKSFQLPAGGEG